MLLLIGSVSRLVRPETDELGDLLTGFIDSQQPLEGIPDDDHLDSSDWGPFQSSFGQPVSKSLTQAGGQRQRLSMHEKLAMAFHECKLMYLKKEHDMKMQILYVELAMEEEEERNMKQQPYQCSSRTSTSSGS
ncbi:unnamed protein product [Coregonus sp. 'balchen']|nr:unnamed protein product [Coregonus sp. 'balchen']